MPSLINTTSFPNPRARLVAILTFLFVILVLGGITTTMLTSQKNQNNSSGSSSLSPLPSSPSSSAFSPLLVYGYWEPGKSYINAFVMNTQKTYTLTILPENVKHISVLPSGTLLYIGNTDKRDYGSEINRYSLTDKTSIPLLKADPGFGIDDYMVSPNGQYLAEFELQFAPGSSIVYGGNERVYSYDLLHPNQKHLLYNEVINHPIPYPRGVTNDGRIFFDTWLPNSGDGWAYGMVVSDFSGTNKQTIPSMANGTYGRQPVLSPDGTQFAFVGYDGNQGDGTVLDSSGIRRVIKVPNTVELLDTATLKRTKLLNLSHNTIYDSVNFDSITGNIIINHLTASPSTTTALFYDLQNQTATKLPVGNQNVFATVTQNNFLVGTFDTSLSTIGNLGNGYQYPVTDFSVFNLTTSHVTQLSVIGSFKQFITFLPAGYLPQSLISQIANANNETLQLGTFELKPTLAPERTEQQNNPPQTRGDHKGSVIGGGSSQGPVGAEGMSGMDCKPALYLYPPQQENITVKISVNGKMTYTNPFYPLDGWHVMADPSGKITYHNQTFDYLYYEAKLPDSFFSNASIQHTGYVVALTDLQQFFSDVLPKLGLNSKETHEFISYWLKALPNSPYYKVSLLPQPLIDSFAPLTVDPKPDTILRVTLYFQPLDHFVAIDPPQLPTVHRTGFTVIEWAGTFKSDKNHHFTCLM